jgi:hypothetical protein
VIAVADALEVFEAGLALVAVVVLPAGAAALDVVGFAALDVVVAVVIGTECALVLAVVVVVVVVVEPSSRGRLAWAAVDVVAFLRA